MPTGLSSTIKTLVIQQWLQGKPRNDIAAENGVSSGAVTNIVNEWRLKPGLAAADELRELAVTMKKVGITAAQCALGFRIATAMLRIGETLFFKHKVEAKKIISRSACCVSMLFVIGDN